MKLKKLLFTSFIIFGVAFSIIFFKPGVSYARSMTLKVSHQFAAGDVRDMMGRVFGDMVYKATNGEIKYCAELANCTRPLALAYCSSGSRSVTKAL